MKGYKATDANMCCRGFQFELGKWHEFEGDLIECQSGFHFCDYPSGPWCYYSEPGTRIWEVEADDVQEKLLEPGADFKRVCRRIKFVKEITPGGHSNTGDSNTGDRNTGDSNTGYSNTGDSNTGYSNTGDSNTGNWNTGYSNTGDRNTGDRNTGNRNTGDRNTGYSNTGNSNTGYNNTGNSNTGNWNATNFSSGMFCAKEPKVVSFDVQTNLTRDQYFKKYPEAYELGGKLLAVEPIDFEPYKKIPGITKAKLKKLHQKHLEGRKKEGT